MKTKCQEIKETLVYTKNEYKDFCVKFLDKDIWGAKDLGQNVEFLIRRIKEEFTTMEIDCLVALLVRSKIKVNKRSALNHIETQGTRVIWSDDLDFEKKDVDWDVDSFPPNLTIQGSLNLWNDKNISRLPNGLVIEGDLKLGSTKKLDTLPDDLVVKGDLYSENIYVLDKAIELFEKGQIKRINPGQLRFAKYNS